MRIVDIYHIYNIGNIVIATSMIEKRKLCKVVNRLFKTLSCMYKTNNAYDKCPYLIISVTYISYTEFTQNNGTSLNKDVTPVV